ncbi:hypothetical protein LXA43DRAFT_304023 [Ganoderma leucocontextum]|nr:hypothetical protein LXA43DRAFT_304023 [Ganoderma leucocontextum]
MPLVDPPYPSFTHVVTKMYPAPRPFDSSRLPSYRAAHVGRFHPYPRGPRRNTEAIYTPTVGYTAPLDPIAEEPEAVVIRPLTVYYDGDSTDGLPLGKLDKPVVGEWRTAGKLKGPAKSATVLADVLLTLRRTYHALLAMRVFHARDEK